jgi:putative proteasome-type protease
MTHQGLVMASDSRSNAGHDQVNVCRKMYTFVQPGERAFIILASGNLSLTQSVVTLLRREFDQGVGLAVAANFYDAARAVGEQVRRVSDFDRTALERDKFSFNVHLLLGGQIRDEAHNLCLLYPQGNPLFATEDSPFLQIGECKYGRPILDRCVRYNATSLAEAAKYALLSIDSTMRSNVTVGPPIDLTVYVRNQLHISQYRRFDAKDPDLRDIQTRWESSLRKAVLELPEIRFGDLDAKPKSPRDERDPTADGGLTERML